jgi:hypothetical protein
MDNVAGQIVLSAIEAIVEMLNFAAWKPQKLLALGPARACRRSSRKKCRSARSSTPLRDNRTPFKRYLFGQLQRLHATFNRAR